MRHTNVSLDISLYNQRKMQYSIATRLQMSLRDELKGIQSNLMRRPHVTTIFHSFGPTVLALSSCISYDS